MILLGIPWSPNAPGVWSPYERAPVYRKIPPPDPGESLFFARQLEYLWPSLYEFKLKEVESLKLIPFESKLEYEVRPPQYERALREGAVYKGISGDRITVRPIPRSIPEPPPLEEKWFRSAVTVTGTFAQVRAWFEARGCTVKPDGRPMRDASGYRIRTADGRWVCDFMAGWRSGRCTAHCDWPRENQDPGDE